MSKPWESWLGVDLYSTRGRLRVDDLAVRSRAADLLGHAARGLSDAAAAYQRLYVPQPSREHPFPSAEALEPARRAEEAARKIGGVADRIRGASFPPEDQLWKQIRQRGAQPLFEFDRLLISQADYAAGLLAATSPENLPALDPAVVAEALAAMEDTLTQRTVWLSGGI